MVKASTENQRRVFQIAYGVLGNRADAEEVAQEAFLQAYRKFHSLRDPEKFRAWVNRITFRLALNRQRGLRRRLDRDAAWQAMGSETTDGVRNAEQRLLLSQLYTCMERMPEKPAQELWVALAGPAVNIVIALALFLLIGGLAGLRQLTEADLVKGDFLVRSMWVNLFLALFNLLPAFPMDGGRVLRALLSKRMGRRRATDTAATVGQAMAILFGIAGFYWNPFLIFIAIFVYLGAQAEAQMVSVQIALKGLVVRDAMLTRYRTMSAEDSLEVAIQELLAGSQQDFPVTNDNLVIGLLRRNDLVKALAERGKESKVGSAMRQDCVAVHPDDGLEKAFAAMRQGECATLPVMERGALVGLLTLENVTELMMVRAALEQNESPESVAQAVGPGGGARKF